MNFYLLKRVVWNTIHTFCYYWLIYFYFHWVLFFPSSFYAFNLFFQKLGRSKSKKISLKKTRCENYLLNIFLIIKILFFKTIKIKSFLHNKLVFAITLFHYFLFVPHCQTEGGIFQHTNHQHPEAFYFFARWAIRFNGAC